LGLGKQNLPTFGRRQESDIQYERRKTSVCNIYILNLTGTATSLIGF